MVKYSANKGCSVIGGHVYRGTEIPRLYGTHIYSNYRSGKVHGFRIEIGEATGHSRLIDSGRNVTSFGEDNEGGIYALTQRGGIYQLIAGCSIVDCSIVDEPGTSFYSPGRLATVSIHRISVIQERNGLFPIDQASARLAGPRQ